MIRNWQDLTSLLKETFSLSGDLLSVLFLIGIQESGEGFRHFTQQEKTDLVKLGKYTLLSRAGYYKKMEVPGKVPFFIPLPTREPPADQEVLGELLKQECIRYFNEHLTVDL